jgi:TPR repeat protein
MRRIAATLAVVGALLFSAGSAWADWDDGMAAFELGDYATALQEWRPLAEQGDAEAQILIGSIYDNGAEGVPQNYTEAVKWYRMAAEQGHAKAQSNLGFMYANGKGVPTNFVKAYMWYSLAQAQGDDVAAYCLTSAPMEQTSRIA